MMYDPRYALRKSLVQDCCRYIGSDRFQGFDEAELPNTLRTLLKHLENDMSLIGRGLAWQVSRLIDVPAEEGLDCMGEF